MAEKLCNKVCGRFTTNFATETGLAQIGKKVEKNGGNYTPNLGMH
jgi:hypothetical protein